jgi:hypothetical protein
VQNQISFPQIRSRSPQFYEAEVGVGDAHKRHTQDMQLICNYCAQPYYPNKSWEDRIRAVLFGAEKYAMCPLCTQAVPDEVFRNERYRQRCHSEVARLQRLFESENKTDSPKVNCIAGPTYEELRARVVADLEKQERCDSLTFKVSEKGGVSIYGLGRFPVTLYYEQWVRLLAVPQELRDFLETNKAKLKLKEQQGIHQQ